MTHPTRPLFFLIVLGLLALSPAAGAYQPAQGPAFAPGLVTATGTPVRIARRVAWDPRGWSPPAWRAFVKQHGGPWRVLLDRDTGVPLQIYGAGIPMPGATRDAGVAERLCRRLVLQHLPLLAPGARPADLRLLANRLDGPIRTVTFAQYARGYRVLGGQVSLRIRADRAVLIASQAFPGVRVSSAAASPVSSATAARRAAAWLRADGVPAPRITAVEPPVVLPLIAHGRRPRYVWARPVRLVSRRPIGAWIVYVDARSGAPVARRQTLRFAQTAIWLDAPIRWPGGGRNRFPGRFLTADLQGLSVTSDATGLVTWSGPAPQSAVLTLVGPRVVVADDSGADASLDVLLQPGGAVVWDASTLEREDAQVTSFVHAEIVQDFARTFAPEEPWLDQPLPVNVNIDDSCNAYSDGNSINLMRGSSQCENTGRLADVVYHEFGHSLHAHAIIPGAGFFDEALSEGLSDALAASLTGDPGMGRGFFRTNAPLRDIDPANREYRWPEDVRQDPHQTGLIIAGALWDLRKALVADLGAEAGARHFLTLYYAAMQRAADIPSTYAEVLVADDDDGDLSNGTPNLCAIEAAFAAHGIAGDALQKGDTRIGLPTLEGLRVSIPTETVGFSCQATTLESAVLSWHLRDWTPIGGTVEMTREASALVAEIPPQEEGQVVAYQIQIRWSDGTEITLPRNPADPWYQVFIGALVPLYCTDFEHDPALDGWTHGLRAGTQTEGADDWMWGPPRAGPESGDPSEAYSGARVFGNDLGGGNFNGKYQPNKVNYASTPVVDASGYAAVRLQYRRWLTVEDAHFDQATIYANDQAAWDNFNSNQGNESKVHHQDREWRFHDVDLTPFVDEDGQLQVTFELASDGGLEFGGWTLDDVCIVGWVPPYCGDGRISTGEECDDGRDNSNERPDACRTRCRRAYCGDGVVDTGEACDDGNVLSGDGCSAQCTLEPPAPEPGCGCRAAAPQSDWPLWALPLLVLALGWRRRTRRLR